MNLSMQTRRAFITLSLAAMAMAFVVAKTSSGAGARAQSDAPVRAETVFVARETYAAPSFVVPVHVAAPMLAAKERAVRKAVRARCETLSAI